MVLNAAPILVWRAGPDKRCDFFNDRWLTFTGRTLDQELGDGWAAGVHVDDLEGCLSTYVEHFDRREPFEMEYRLRRADGAYRWILDRGAPFFGADGGFAGYIGSCIDITDRKEVERLREEAQAAEIAKLQKLLPICAWCHKVRTDDGYWTSVETYLKVSKIANVTHGICEACADRVSPA